jgi:hypothetical protein
MRMHAGVICLAEELTLCTGSLQYEASATAIGRPIVLIGACLFVCLFVLDEPVLQLLPDQMIRSNEPSVLPASAHEQLPADCVCMRAADCICVCAI